MELFEELGLTKNESKVYEVLIKFGKLGAGEVSAKSEVPYGRIYGVLNSLIVKGLAKVIPEKSKKFAPGDPEHLQKIIDERENRLRSVRNKIEELKKMYEVKEKNPVVVGEGRKGFYKIVTELKNPEKYAYNIKLNVEYRTDWVESRKKKMKQGIDARDLVRYDKETEKNVKDWLKVSKNIRRIDNEGVAMSILDDEEVMIALIKSNVTLLIKDKPFAKIMKQMFLATYDKAEEIK